jgi:site-specific DNA-methyltransferase (adenine-specific)
MKNTLYYGDNLIVLKRYITSESVDLIYLDPPFNSDQVFNIFFKEQNGSKSSAQIKVFEDTWHWDLSAESAYQETIEGGGKVADIVQGLRRFLGENNLMAYLIMMVPRLKELHRVLKPTGSLFLHCDPTASHYLKLILDAIFGWDCFQNEIIWCYTIGGKSKRRFAEKHDVIFFYSKTKDGYTFNGQAVAVVRPKTHMKTEIGEDGRKYQVKKDAKTGKIYRYPIDEGKIPEDYWHIETLNREDKERLGFPTQKPERLLERIVKACSNEGDTILDPFCGCGTTISVAEKLKRKWYGIDITALAITLIKNRLITAFDDVCFDIIGEPTTIQDAQKLALEDKFQFQWWALGLVGARPTEQKKGADHGIDGRKYFFDTNTKYARQIIFSVKGGENISVKDIRDLRGVIERDKAALGVFISLELPSKPMVSEAAAAGFYQPGELDSIIDKTRYPRIQLLTIDDLLAGKSVQYPALAISQDTTFKPAPERVKEKKEKKQSKLDL